jgi:two-component sensor histidine kinase
MQSAGYLSRMDEHWRQHDGGRLRLRLAPDVHAPSRARQALRELPLGEREEDVLLLASELVTNAVQHGGAADDQPIELEATCDGGCARVEVRDRGRGFGRAPQAGLGLRLLEDASVRWGIDHADSTRVWFEVSMGRGGFEPPSVGL